MEKSKKILKVENLKKAYYSTSRTGEIITYPVLNNVSFEIEEGEFVGIMGRSGCGKTTLLKAVGMLDKPDDGTIYYKDKDTKDIYRAELARLRRTEIAFVFQDYYLMDSLSIKENIMLPLILDEADVQESKKKCEEMAEKFAITDLLDKKPYELSGGEKQRTAICRALIYNPDLILADEPTGNLDSASSEVVIHTLEEINKKREEADKKIKAYEDEINRYQSEIRIKESRLKFLIETEKEKEGYIKSVKSLLKDCENIKELGKGMHGVLANIIEVPEEYQTAIEMCLGASLQNIVTETEEDAKKLVQHLRKNNLGRASFLPITSVRGRKLDKIKGHEKGVVGIASDIVKFNKKYEQIVLNLLGRTVIVDNMETAIKVAKQNGYTFRIITIEGDVINPSGAITGGSVAKKTVNILGR